MQAKEQSVTLQKQQLLSQIVERCADDVTSSQKKQLFQLLLEFNDVLAEDGELGRTDRLKHRIDTESSHPIRQPVRRLPLSQRTEVRDLLADMKAKNVI